MAELEEETTQEEITQPIVEETVIEQQPVELTPIPAQEIEITPDLTLRQEQEPEVEKVKKVESKDFTPDRTVSEFTDQMNNNYPNLDFKGFGESAVQVKNISTGEEFIFQYPSKSDLQLSENQYNDRLERLNNFIEFNAQEDSESKYIYEATGITPTKTDEGAVYEYGGVLGIGEEKISKTRMYASVRKTERIAEDLFVKVNPFFEKYDVDQLAGLQIDFNQYSEQQLDIIKNTIYNKVNKELVNETGFGIDKDIFFKIYDTNTFQQKLNSSISQAADEKIYQLAKKKYGTTDATDSFKQYKTTWLNNQLPPVSVKRLEAIETINDLKTRLEEAEARGNKQDIVKVRQQIASLEESVFGDTRAFDPSGFWILPEDEKDADRMSKSINSAYIESAFLNTLSQEFGITTDEDKTDVSRMEALYNDQMFLSQNIHDIGNESKLEFNLDIEGITEAAARGIEGGDVQSMLQEYKEKNPEAYDEKTGKLTMSYNDFYNSSVSVKDLEGFFDEAMGYIDVDKLMPYKAWKEEKIETDGVLQGIHSLLYLNLNPASVQKEYAPAVFTRNLIKAFATGDIYGEMDEEKAQQTSNYYMGRDPRQVLNNMQTAIDAFNADNPDNQLSLSDEQRDNINQTITELTSSGLGQMVPFLFEMALIGTVTEGAGLTPYISRLPGYLRLPAIMGVEEIKMGLAPSAPYHAGTGATFGALGQLTSKIPYKVFEKNFRLLRPFYEKVVKSGWVGASSTQVNEIVQAFSKDLMGDEDFMTEFNNLYGGVLEGKPEDIKELLKTLLVDSFVFGISGAAHLGKNDFKSTAAKKSLISDINKEIEKAKKELDDIGLTTTPGEKLSVDKSIEFYQGILKNSSASKELKAAIKTRLDKISGLVNTAANLQRSIDFEQTVNDFDPKNKDFTKNYKEKIIDKVSDRLKKRVAEYNEANPNNKLSEPNIEFITGEGEAFRNNNDFNKTQAAKLDILGNGNYRIFLDMNKYSAGKPVHEIGHIFQAEHLRLNPNARANMIKNPLSETMENTVIYTNEAGEKLTGGDLKSIVNDLYKQKTGEVKEQEFMTNMLELLTDPNFYFTNPEISGSMLKQLKSDFQNVLKKYNINLFNGVSEIRTVEDLVKSIYTLGNEVGSGFISESSLDLLENLSAGKYNDLGGIAITDVVAKEQYMKNQLNEAKSELQKEFASEDIFKVFKLSDKAKQTNKTLQQEIKDNEKDPGIPSEKQKAELITNNIPLVNSIAFNQSLYTKFNLENIPQNEMELVAEELYYDLIKAVDRYNANESAPETWIRNNLKMRLPAKLRKTGYFNRLVEKGGDDATALMENLSGLEAEISSTSLYSINNMNVTPEVPTRFDTYYKGNEKEATQEYDKIKSNIELSEIGNNISSYATTPARASSSFYERIGVPENKVKTETGEYKIRPTRINEKQLDKAQEWLENNFEEIFDILPEGYVPSGEYMATPGEPLIVSDKLGGTATGVQTVLEKLPIYEKTGVREKDKRGVGIEGYTKVKELTPEIKKATLEAFGIREDAPNIDIKENKNLSTLFQSIIYQSDKALTNQVVDNIAVKEIKDRAVINDLRAGKTTSLASEDLVEVLIGQLSLVDSKKYSGENGRQNLLALLEEVEKNGSIPNNAEGNAIRNATVNQVRWEKDSIGFKAQAKKAGLTIAEPFRSKSKGVVTTDVDAQNRHIDDAIAIINEFLPDVATQSRSTKTGKEGTFLPAMYKLGSNRLVGNVGSEQGVKLVDVINKNKKSIAEIKDPEVREAWEKFSKLADKFEPANSDKMKGFNIGTILDIAEGDKVVSFLGNDGKAYIYDPTGQKTRPTKGVTIIKGNSRNSKANAIDKVFDKDVIESLRAYDYAFNLSLQKWYNSESAKGTKQKKRAEEFLYRHFQMTTNQVMSDRAFAPFTSILLKDGVQKFYKKGEHVQDAATNTVKKYEAILNNKYDFNFHELLSSGYFQSLTEKSQLDFIDKILGTNTQIGLEKLLVGPGSEVPAKDLYDFSKGKYVFDILVDNFVSRVTDQVKLTETNKKAAKKITPPESNAGEKQTIETVVENPKEASEVLQVSGEKIRKAKLEGEQNKEQAKKKVIFMIGGPGSGKSNVGKGLQLGREGFKVVNQDIYIERAKKEAGLPENEKEYTKEQRSLRSKIGAQGRKIAQQKLEQYTEAGEGMVVDGTGASYNATMKKVNKLKEQGYEVFFVHAKTSMPTAIERNAARKERSLPQFIVEKTQKSVEENIERYKKDLGENFIQIDTETFGMGESLPAEFVAEVRSKLRLKEKGKEEAASVFDLDDNLVVTRTKVKYELPKGEKGELDAQEFNMYKEALEADGATFDYSEFNKVIKEKLGPAFDLFKKEYARSPEDAFIMTARAPGSKKAIKAWLKSEGFEVPLENIITTEGTEFAEGELKGENKKGYEILGFYTGKYGKKYDKINFTDDYLPNVESVKFVTDQLDITGKVYQTFASEDISFEFDNILEQSTGFKKDDIVSYAVAVNKGSKADKKKQLVPYSAEDFTGLLYTTLGKGKQGEQQFDFYKRNLLDPYGRGVSALETDRVNMMRDFKALKKNLKTPKNLDKDAVLGFSNQDAIRVYLWNKQGEKIPGLTDADIAKLNNHVIDNPELASFAENILQITKGDKYSKPKESWMAGTITTDLMDLLNGAKRKKYLSQFLDNKDIIFSEDNKNKLRAKYGNKYVEALENSLSRMERGSNRIFSGSRLGNRVLDYINNSNGATMFLNTRSAVLQTISSANYINWSFNNPLAASKALANQPQYWKDFMTLMNSDYLSARRGGLKMNVSENEIAEAAKRSNNSIQGAMSYAIEKGYSLTKYADSFAIASGGATFYRNRIKDLIKREGLSEAEAEKKAYEEWREISEISQQSSDPSKISKQQTTDLGRLLLAFANTPMQYTRIQKRAIQDLVARRGDDKTNVSKLLYYGFVQNMMFNALQQALFAADENDVDEKTLNTINGMIDSQLKGMGIGGNTVMMVKNVVQDIYKRSGRKRPEYIDAVWKVATISPAINSKVSKLKQAAYQFDSKQRRAEMMEKGLSLDNPFIEASTNVIEAATNVPVNRTYDKLNNVIDALDQENEWWQSVAMLAGWPEWQLKSKEALEQEDKKKGGYQSEDMFTFGKPKKKKQTEEDKVMFKF